MKKIFLAILIALGLSLGVITVAKALLTDTETSMGNTVRGASLNLKVGDNDPTTYSFSFDNIAPGEVWQSWSSIESTGSISGNFWLDLAVSNSGEGDNPEAETDILGDGELESCAEIKMGFFDPQGAETLLFDFTPVAAAVGSHDQLVGSVIDALIEAGATNFNIEMRTDACGNEAMGDQFDVDLIFYLDQV